jgi:D-amino-acid dehydrogenase
VAEPDVLVIGGGVVGVSAAYALARAGAAVTLVEMGALCNGSSWGNAGLLCPCHSTPVPGPGVLWQGIRWMFNPESPFYLRPRLDAEFAAWLVRFARYCNAAAQARAIPLLRDLQRRSLALYREWIAAEGLDCDFEKAGGIELYLTEEKFSHAAPEVEKMRAHGLDWTLLDRAAVHAREPAAHPDVVGGIYYGEDAHLNPAKFVAGLADAARRYGAQIWTNTPVTGLRREGARLTGAATPGGWIQPREVVLAAGAWSGQLARQLGVHLPMQAGKGYSISMRRPASAPRHPLHLAEARMAITPMGGWLRFGGTMELSGIDTSINQRRVDAILRNGKKYLVDMGEPVVEKVWGGMRPLTPDGLPYLGRARQVTNLIAAAGHGMLGVSLGPVTGLLVKQLVYGEPPEMGLEALEAGRFG